MIRPKIGLDWDDVTAPFNSIAIEMANEKYNMDPPLRLEDITSPELKRKLRSLSPKDLAILDLYVFEEKTQQEVAKEMQLSQQAIQKRLKKIAEILGSD